MNLYLLVFLASIVTAAAEQTRYDGYKTVSVSGSRENVIAFNDLANEETDRKVIMLTPTEFVVSPDELERFTNQTEEFHLDHTIVNNNVQRSIDVEEAVMKSAREYSKKKYNSYDQIMSHIEVIAVQNDYVSLVRLEETTHEGRDMYVVKVEQSTGEENDVFIECGAHAREWISPAVCTQLIDLLAKESGACLRTKATYHILPVTNPDGYEYSRNSERLWRKNRRPMAGTSCVGVDLNRNFEAKEHWGTTGVNFKPCSNVYPGSEPLSEPETRNIDTYLKTLEDDGKTVTIFLSLHSYGQMILVPFGYAVADKPANYNELFDKGKIASKAMKSMQGKKYRVMKSSDLYPAAGGSDDYAILSRNIEYAYTWELRPGPNSAIGFELNANKIKPSGREVAIGLKALVDAVF